MSECYSCGFDAEEHLRKTHEAANVLADRDRLAARVRVLEEALTTAADAFKRYASAYRPGDSMRDDMEREEVEARAALGAVAAPVTEEKAPSQLDDEKDFQRCWHCGAYASEC